jgi:hypothetical protein
MALADTITWSIRLTQSTRELRLRCSQVRRHAVWVRGSRRRSIQGASDREPSIAALIEAKVAAGLLPRDRPARVWVGPGSGKACEGCAQPIRQDQREYEFDPPGWPTIRMHQDCLSVWHVARMRDASGQGHHPPDSYCVDTSGARLAAVLHGSHPAGYCVECVAMKMNLSVKEVRDAAQVLVARPGFRVVERECYCCGHIKDVVVFVGRPSPGESPASTS